jgi:hypothetical protein
VGQRDLGLRPHIAGFVYPLGATLCMHGTALFEGVTVIFLAQVFGVHMGLASRLAKTDPLVLVKNGPGYETQFIERDWGDLPRTACVRVAECPAA